jgi:hypothetical protein
MMSKRKESNREKSLRKYFKDSPEKRKYLPSFLLIIIGIMLMFSVFQINTEFAFIPIAAVAFGGIMMTREFIRRAPSDSQVDKWLDEGIENLKKESLTKLSLVEEELKAEDGPLIVRGPIPWITDGVPEKDLVWKIGKDGIPRFGVYRISIIQLTENLLGAYSCDYNFIKNEPLNEETDEYHYRDIVTVSTKEIASPYTLSNGKTVKSVEAFRVSVTNGEAIEVIINANNLNEMIGSEKIPEYGAQKAVRTIKAMLRDKKK